MHLRSVLLSLAVSATANPLAPRQQVCNGNAALCSRKYSNVTLIGAHDSPFVGPIIDPRVNQEKSVADQLAAGIRFFTGQTHKVSSAADEARDAVHEIGDAVDDVGDTLKGIFSRAAELHMCHTSCAELDSGTLLSFLSTFRTFLDANPNEVVTILLVNGDYDPVTSFASVFQAAGLVNYAFVPSTSPNTLPIDSWPTYAELISSGKRLVVFMDYDANESQVPYILSEFNYFFETPYDTTDPDFKQCTLDRPPNSSPAGKMYLVNHYLDKELLPNVLIPDNAQDYQTNAATGDGSIGAQADLCRGIYGKNPNVVLVDMFDRGDVFTAQKNLNGL